MNPFLLAEAKHCQDEVNRRYDPSIRIVWAPKIQRFVICEDKLVTRDGADRDGNSASPWITRDSDLEGAEFVGPFGPQLIGERTTLETRRRLETREGDYIPPYAELVIKILAIECPRAGDRDPTEFGMPAERRRLESRRSRILTRIKDAMPSILVARRHRVYSTPSAGFKAR